MKKTDLFLAGWGMATLFVQLPIVKMVLDDPQTLWLGSWNWAVLAVFCAITFVVLPAIMALVFWAAFRLNRRFGLLLIALAIGYFVTIQVNFYYLSFHFPYAVWRRPVVIGMILAFLPLVGRLGQPTVRILKVCGVFSIGLLVLFVLRALPVQAVGSAGPLQPVVTEEEGALPVFCLTFEKLVSSYITDAQGRILADRFPNLARFVQTADWYPNAYANSLATGYALKTVYTGRIPILQHNWTRYPNLRDILGADRQTFMLLDLLDYCRPGRDTCIRSIATENLQGLHIVRGWYKTYLNTVMPGPLKERFELAGWHFNPWHDLWVLETENLKPGEKLSYKVGIRQLEKLTALVRQEGRAPHLYIMHSFISDNPGTQTSAIQGRTESEYQEDLERARMNLAVFDRQLGLFLDALQETGVYDDALILIDSDTAYDPSARYIRGEEEIPDSPELARIFLAIKRPGQAEGRVIPSVMRQIDVLPTLLTNLGMEVESYGFEGVPVTQTDKTITLAERPVELLILTTRSGRLSYRLTREGGPFQVVKRQ